MGEVVGTRGAVATPDTAWRVLADLDNAVSTIDATEAVERLDGRASDLCTSWSEPRTMFVRTVLRY